MTQGIIGLVRYLSLVGLLTILWRGLLRVGVNLMARRVPGTVGFMTEVERYGWWIALALGAVMAAAV